ncbi:unnamed protein product [Symbiodinium sp. KB8]|nr:unnamed protein product [Symbiodinium sp. KB8]
MDSAPRAMTAYHGDCVQRSYQWGGKTVRRVFRFGSEARATVAELHAPEPASLIGARSQVFLPKNTVLMTVLLEESYLVVQWRSILKLMRHNATSHMQLAVLVLLLLSAELGMASQETSHDKLLWVPPHVLAWCARCSAYLRLAEVVEVLLLVQYVYTFKLITFPDEEVESYWGLHNQQPAQHEAEAKDCDRSEFHGFRAGAAAVSTGKSLLAAFLVVLCNGLQWVYGSGPDLWLRRLVGLWTDCYEDCLPMLCQGDTPDNERRELPAGNGGCCDRNNLHVAVLGLRLHASDGALDLSSTHVFESYDVPGLRFFVLWLALLLGSTVTPLLAPQHRGWTLARVLYLAPLLETTSMWKDLDGLARLAFQGFLEWGSTDVTLTFMALFCVRDLRRVQEDHAKGEDEAFGASPGPGEEESHPSVHHKHSYVQQHASRQPHVSIISLGEHILLSPATGFQVVAFLLVCFQAPVAVELAGCSEKTCPETFFVSPDVCRLLAAHDSTAWRAGWRPLTVLLQSLGVQKFREGHNRAISFSSDAATGSFPDRSVSFSWANLWIFVIFLISNLQALALERWEGDFQAENQNQIERIDLRERWYQEHLLHWRRLELRRIDTKHKVLLVKLRCLTGFITELRAIWQNRRGELTTQERSQRAREDRIHNLCLSSGLPPAAVQPVLEAFVQAAAKAAGPCGELLKMDSAPEGSSHGVTPILPVAPMAAAVEYQAMAGGPENFRSTLRSSMMRANVFALESLFVLGCYGWMLLCPEVQWPGHTKNAWRCTLLFTFGVAYMLRLNAMARWLLPRELAQEELTVVILWIMSILVSFAVGALLKGTLDWMTCCLAVFLYCLGSWLNTWSELQRKWWKARAENKGRCYTLGLFSLSRNINYFGDVVLFLGWAVATGCWWNLWAPATMAASFYFYHIPDKDQYLSKRYSSDWPEYVSRIEAAEEINQCVCEHLKDLQLQRLRRISAKEVSERKTLLLERCARAGEVVQDAAAAPQASQVQEGSATLQTGIPEEAAGEDAEVPTESDASALRRSKYRRQNSLLGDGFLATGTAKEKQALFADVKVVDVRCLEMARGALGLLVDDFLYTYDPARTVHLDENGFQTLDLQAFWSQTKGLIMFNLTIVLLKVLYQLPIFPTSFDYVQLKADMQSGFLNGVPVPWESVLGLEKVAPAGPLPGQNNEEVLVTDAVRELEERGLVGHSLLGLLSAIGTPFVTAAAWAILRTFVEGGDGQQDPPTQKCEHGKLGSRDFIGHLLSEHVASLDLALHRDARDCLDFAGLRKPAMDLFAPCCFCIVLISWNSLMDNRESFADSLSSSSFSGKQVMAVALFIGLLVEARAEYTWYTQHRSKGPDGWQFQAKERNLQPTMNLIMYFAQRIILLTELVTLHSFFIVRWSSSTTYQPRMTNSIQMLFYVFFMLYLALTSLQLRYDVHVTSGGLGLTHSMNFFYSVAFKAYLAVPFVEEMRVLTDWTVTRTSMDFFMWMKLEDAQQGLYRTKRDFHMRRWYPPAAARPTWEKVLQGGLLLVGLALLIVGPIALFSSLNPSLQSNRLTSGTLTATLLVQSSDQAKSKHNPKDFDGRSRMDTSNVTWVEESERSFDSTDPSSLAARITESLSDPDVTAWIEIEYVLLFNGDTSQSKRAELPPRRVKLSKNATLQLGRLVNESLDLSDIQEDPIFISQATTKTLRVSSNLEAQYTGKEMDFLLTFRSSEFGVHRHSHGRDRGSQLRAAPVRGVWLLSKASPECWAKQAGSSDSEGRGQARVDCRISQFVASEKSAPAPMGYSGSWGVMGIYLGVVYAVGRFLRLVFQDSSKRAIYEELPDVQLLQDLCNGIYIARIQHLLKTEFKLYYQLMNLFRSPELLLTVTGTFGAQKIDGEMDFLAELDDGHLGFDSAGTRVQSDPRLKAPETFGSLGTTAISPIPGSEQGSQETGEMPQASENTNVDDDLRQIQELQEELDHHFGDVPMPSVGRFAGVADSEMPLGDVTVATELRGGENPIPTSPTSELRRRHLQAAASSGNAGISTSSRLEM